MYGLHKKEDFVWAESSGESKCRSWLLMIILDETFKDQASQNSKNTSKFKMDIF